VKDLADISTEVKKKLEIVPVARIEDVLKTALVRMPDPITWAEVEAAAVAAEEGKESSRVTAH
jgi:ATP-dependent Lon protease